MIEQKIDIRKTKAFQIKRAKELGMTLNQYLGRKTNRLSRLVEKLTDYQKGKQVVWEICIRK